MAAVENLGLSLLALQTAPMVVFGLHEFSTSE